MLKSKEIKLDIKNNNDLFSLNSCYENIEKQMKKDLELDLGVDNYKRIYKTISDNLHESITNYNKEHLESQIKKLLDNQKTLIDTALNRIPDIYCLILKDRMMVL